MEIVIEHRASVCVMKDIPENHAKSAINPLTLRLEDFAIESVNAPMTARMQVYAIT